MSTDVLSDTQVYDFQSLVQSAVIGLHSTPTAPRGVVEDQPVFLLGKARGWVMNLEGDRFWVQTWDDVWHEYDVFNMPPDEVCGFKHLLKAV